MMKDRSLIIKMIKSFLFILTALTFVSFYTIYDRIHDIGYLNLTSLFANSVVIVSCICLSAYSSYYKETIHKGYKLLVFCNLNMLIEAFFMASNIYWLNVTPADQISDLYTPAVFYSLAEITKSIIFIYFNFCLFKTLKKR